jgi:hypothetical protein
VYDTQPATPVFLLFAKCFGNIFPMLKILKVKNNASLERKKTFHFTRKDFISLTNDVPNKAVLESK